MVAGGGLGIPFVPPVTPVTNNKGLLSLVCLVATLLGLLTSESRRSEWISESVHETRGGMSERNKTERADRQDDKMAEYRRYIITRSPE